MKMRPILISVIAVTLSGCAGSQFQMSVLQDTGDLQIIPSDSKAYDYTVLIRNRIDIGFNPDDPENRKYYALHLLERQCPNGKIVGEKTIETGTYAFGNPARRYAMQIKCNT